MNIVTILPFCGEMGSFIQLYVAYVIHFKSYILIRLLTVRRSGYVRDNK